MAYSLVKATPALIRAYDAAYAPAAVTEAVCPDRHYEKIPNIAPIQVSDGEFITYSTPDSAFFVTRQRLEAAERSILIGIYDFTAEHMKDLLIDAVNRGVAVTLMLDCNFSQLPGEQPVFNALVAAGVRCIPAPSCQGGTNRFFRVAHEKVIVIDDLWTLVQSGNYSNNSIPLNQSNGLNTPNFRTGNRDMGVAIKSTEVAAFFSSLINNDIALELGVEAEHPAVAPTGLPPLFEAVVEAVQFDLFPSKTFPLPGPVPVLPVLTPDNYMDVVPDFIASATRSIFIEQQYIRNINFNDNASIRQLVMSITSARQQNPGLVARIIVAPPFNENSQSDRTKLRRELDALASVGLIEGTNVRLLNKNHLKHCHNKLVIVDQEKVLISSQNWSEPAVTINREAGVMIAQQDIAEYFAEIFEEDWENAFQALEAAPDTELFMLDNPTPDNIEAVLEAGFEAVEWGDHADI